MLAYVDDSARQSGQSVATTATTRVPYSAPAYTSHIPTGSGVDGVCDGTHADQALPPPLSHISTNTLSVGDKQAPPAVAISELQYHPRIPGPFSKLRHGVKTAWAIFLSLAVYRFHLWIISMPPTVEGALAPGPIPPIDVNRLESTNRDGSQVICIGHLLSVMQNFSHSGWP